MSRKYHIAFRDKERSLGDTPVVRSGAEDATRKLTIQEMEALGEYLLNPETFNEQLRRGETEAENEYPEQAPW